MSALIAGYTMLAALRDLREKFAREPWIALNDPVTPTLYAVTEVPVRVIMLIGLAMRGMVREQLLCPADRDGPSSSDRAVAR